jgi:hypothetical protein
MHVSQVHEPPLVVGGLIPAAVQLKPVLGVSTEVTLLVGFGVSQAAHLGALSELVIRQVLQIQAPSFSGGGLAPAAAQLNP